MPMATEAGEQSTSFIHSQSQTRSHHPNSYINVTPSPPPDAGHQIYVATHNEHHFPANAAPHASNGEFASQDDFVHISHHASVEFEQVSSHDHLSRKTYAYQPCAKAHSTLEGSFMGRHSHVARDDNNATGSDRLEELMMTSMHHHHQQQAVDMSHAGNYHDRHRSDSFNIHVAGSH